MWYSDRMVQSSPSVLTVTRVRKYIGREHSRYCCYTSRLCLKVMSVRWTSWSQVRKGNKTYYTVLHFSVICEAVEIQPVLDEQTKELTVVFSMFQKSMVKELKEKG